MPLAELRKEYNLAGLRRSDLAADPIAQFKLWLEQAAGARASGRVRKFFVNLYKAMMLTGGGSPMDVNAMALATADKQGRPSARVVLLKGVDERGFVFFTNYESRKAQELTENPQAALVFYWSDLERQVCVSGTVTKVPREESEAYFKSRPRGSRLAAWASKQSQAVRDRATLEQKWKQLEAQYPGPEVPLPSWWGGYVLAPVRIQFWQGRPNRLHDRFCYTRQSDGTWLIERLWP
ncbi:MAG: pyridoxamine 5'-phosphate oxidase [Verrucomicrobia bacterium]|nr:MAG: pyridoxamine 5'-phosphate oxidase [Verrucomicrobiota bacterium]